MSEKLEVRLLGNDGNGAFIIAKCRKAMRRAKWPEAKIEAVTLEMKAGDYDHLLQVADQYFAIT